MLMYACVFSFSGLLKVVYPHMEGNCCRYIVLIHVWGRTHFLPMSIHVLVRIFRCREVNSSRFITVPSILCCHTIPQESLFPQAVHLRWQQLQPCPQTMDRTSQNMGLRFFSRKFTFTGNDDGWMKRLHR